MATASRFKPLAREVPAGPRGARLHAAEKKPEQPKKSAAVAAKSLQKPPPTLTKEQSMALEVELMQAYFSKQFQEQLHSGWQKAQGDPLEQLKARQEACFPAQVPIIEKYGFAPTKKGVVQSVAAFKPFENHPDESARTQIMGYLINPGLQQVNSESITANLSGKWIVRGLFGHEDSFVERSYIGTDWQVIGVWEIFHDPEQGNSFEVYFLPIDGSELKGGTGHCSNGAVQIDHQDKFRFMAMLTERGKKAYGGYVWQPDVHYFIGLWWMQKEEEPEKQGHSEQHHQHASKEEEPIMNLRLLDTRHPLLYGGWMEDGRAPSVFYRTTIEALMEYLRDDPDGPFQGLVDDWPAAKVAKDTRWGRWNFQTLGEQEPLLKADWHSVHGWGFQNMAFVPRNAELCCLKRAPRRILAFMESFREVNIQLWRDIDRELHEVSAKSKNASEDLIWLVDMFSSMMRKRACFGSIEAQVWWGDKTITTRSHKDGATSLLHLSLTLSGRRCVRVGFFNESLAPEVKDPFMGQAVEEDVWQEDMWKWSSKARLKNVDATLGTMYFSAPFIFEHGVQYEKCDRNCPVIALQCRWAFPSRQDAMRVNSLRNSAMLTVTQVIARTILEAGERGELRAPTLDEVRDAERRIAHGEATWARDKSSFEELFTELLPPLRAESTASEDRRITQDRVAAPSKEDSDDDFNQLWPT